MSPLVFGDRLGQLAVLCSASFQLSGPYIEVETAIRFRSLMSCLIVSLTIAVYTWEYACGSRIMKHTKTLLSLSGLFLFGAAAMAVQEHQPDAAQGGLQTEMEHAT